MDFTFIKMAADSHSPTIVLAVSGALQAVKKAVASSAQPMVRRKIIDFIFFMCSILCKGRFLNWYFQKKRFLESFYAMGFLSSAETYIIHTFFKNPTSAIKTFYEPKKS
jgi:hypothetical protein